MTEKTSGPEVGDLIMLQPNQIHTVCVDKKTSMFAYIQKGQLCLLLEKYGIKCEVMVEGKVLTADVRSFEVVSAAR